ncbi:hypothetical protein LO772_20490 [Yinghuangia sp. ASG 101]|uniref:hypothetical protein n=1 Tax=Yinghuangia sp. ASG 101 TaxID=2896848 RepID=UPI001E5E5449|nr:hypothetical protein [Yinghuangia sp. ASG 101]UGQ09322.1 hypothetical protein LO772_20490 [Yinghuangia sp. ASG 101]
MPDHGETEQPPATGSPAPTTAPGRAAPRRSDVFGWDGYDVLPDVTADERDRGWGDDRGSADSSADADLRRFLDEKPPHHF